MKQKSRRLAELLVIIVIALVNSILYALRKVSNMLVVVWIIGHRCTKLLCCPRIAEWVLHYAFHSLGALPLCIYLLYYKILLFTNSN